MPANRSNLPQRDIERPIRVTSPIVRSRNAWSG
jgi:hypothetical protein